MSENKREIYDAICEVSIDIPMAEYNISRNVLLTSGNLKRFRDDGPADFQEHIDNPQPYDSHAMKIGRALHTLTLEGLGVMGQEYTIGDDAPINNTKAGKGKPYGPTSQKYLDWVKEKQVDGKTLLSVYENNKVVTMHNALMANEKMAEIFSEGIAEQTLRANYLGIDCQIRPDWITPVFGMMDLKKCAILKRFKRDAKFKYKYFHAAAFYRSVTRMALNMDYEDLPFCLCAVEEARPYKTLIYELDEEVLNFCERENAEAMEKMLECGESGKWPTGYEGIELIYEM